MDPWTLEDPAVVGSRATQAELVEYTALAAEGRRRVKEQLRRRNFSEFNKPSFSILDLTDEMHSRTVVLGDLTVQGNVEKLSSIVELLQVVLENGALRALVPLGNRAQFAALPEEVVEKMDLAFYGDVDRAVVKGVEA